MKQIRLRPGVVVIDRGHDIFVGHIQKNLNFTDKNVIPILNRLQQWISHEQLLAMDMDCSRGMDELIARLDGHGFIETHDASINKPELIISHMNEVGTLLAPLLMQHGFTVSTLDLRSATMPDVRGQYLRISDIGESFKEVIAAQQRELRNSGKYELAEARSVRSSQKLFIMTNYPEPELLASMMAEGNEYVCAMATPFGAIIGPLVKPGISPCFFCLELWRSELDDQWQKIAATLFMERNKPVAMAPALLTVAALGKLLVPLIHSEIPHEYLGTTFSLSFDYGASTSALPTIKSAIHRWGVHPDCSCHWGR